MASTDHSHEFKVHVFSSASELVDKLHEKWNGVKKLPYSAMYSSVYGGIILDPALMVIPIDDHMVYRSDGVFDTAIIFDGHLYELDTHLDIFLRSAAKARIATPFPKSVLRTILIQLAAVSKISTGTLRYWLSAGPGDFLLSPAGCPSPAFYAVVIDESINQCKEGVKVITSKTISMNSHPPFGTMKNVNYFPNVLSKMEAVDAGAYASTWVYEKGYITDEGANYVNVGFITKGKDLILPYFEKILRGCTAQRLFELAPKMVYQGQLKSVKLDDFTVGQAKGAASEMFYIGSTLPLVPIIEWDKQPIGDGKVGELTLALSNLVWEDMLRYPVPY